MNIAGVILAGLVFPGLVYALAISFLMLWTERKIEARVQRRIGPPFYQPFFDAIKLLGKRPVGRPGLQGFLMGALPVATLVVMLGAVALLPVVPLGVGFRGDLVLFVALVEAGPLLGVLGGFASRSMWGGLGASREAVMTAAYNLPFLTALIALAWGGPLSLAALPGAASWPVRVLAVLAIALCLPAKLHINPFSVSNAEQELYTGATTEYDGWRLALWEIAHGVEWVVLTGLVAVLVLPDALGYWRIPAFILVSLIMVAILSLGAAATARLKLAQAARWFWAWGLLVAAGSLVLAMLGVGR